MNTYSDDNGDTEMDGGGPAAVPAILVDVLVGWIEVAGAIKTLGDFDGNGSISCSVV